MWQDSKAPLPSTVVRNYGDVFDVLTVAAVYDRRFFVRFRAAIPKGKPAVIDRRYSKYVIVIANSST
jgi:hypothetical protein